MFQEITLHTEVSKGIQWMGQVYAKVGFENGPTLLLAQ
jgi:hypothetical protein